MPITDGLPNEVSDSDSDSGCGNQPNLLRFLRPVVRARVLSRCPYSLLIRGSKWAMLRPASMGEVI